MPHLPRFAALRIGAGLFGASLPGMALCAATPGQDAPLPQAVARGLDGDSALAYADLVDLALPAESVVRATVRKAVRLKPAEAPGLQAGRARLYIEARTGAVLIGPELGESVRFLADVPLDARDKVPKLTRTEVLILARTVADRADELQLVAPDAMLALTPAREATLRAILTETARADAPPAITAVREVLHVSGNLAGEGETQLFLGTTTGAPVSISVLRAPGRAPSWGVSFTEIVDSDARPPLAASLAWYRLACGLPQRMPERTNISGTLANRRIAAEDYALVLSDLGPCTRRRGAF